MLTQKQTCSKENNVKMALCYNPFKNQGETDQNNPHKHYKGDWHLRSRHRLRIFQYTACDKWYEKQWARRQLSK
jgi:hypothetical protein